ncbi:MAG: YhdH/YhfP family quinone oxidoreductase [Paludibacter sp.]|nr:YhdH/YhfP family quinone oxidoreductase [Paludibacter sp.]
MVNFDYKSLVTEELGRAYVTTVKILNTAHLPQNDVLMRVKYSSVNYKDALSATGNKGVTKKFPHTPGIDAAGVVVRSKVESYKAGDEVIVSGYDLGMNTPGGFGQYINVPSEWVVPLPKGLTLKESMIIGTAGFTAGISTHRLTQLVKPHDGKIVVTGATGGVGSVAISLLSKLGYQVIAVSGKASEHDYLKKLGATEIISRNDFQVSDGKAVSSARFAGGIDTVGGVILENIIKSLHPLGAVTTCGSVSSTQLNISAFPFILRGISLIGISAQNYPFELRKVLWDLLSDNWKPTNLMEIYTEISLEEVDNALSDILQGKLKGRVIVNLGL